MTLRRRLRAAMRVLFNRYEGAQFSFQRSHIPAAVQSARFDATGATRSELVRKSRYFEKNSGIVNRLADLFECYTVGSGLQLNPSSSNPEWNERAKTWWGDWERNCDLISRQPFSTLQSLMSRTWFIDGEIFIRKTEGDTGKPRIQLYEGHHIATPQKLKASEGQNVVDGVSLDQRGRPDGYWVASEASQNQVDYFEQAAQSFIHLFEPGRAGQYRGLPFLYPVINDLHDLDDLQRLEMDAAKEHAAVSKIIKTETGELDTTEDILRGTGASQDDGQIKYDYYKDVIGSDVKVLKWGDDYDLKSSTRPSVVTREYWQYLTSKVCAGVGIDYSIVFPSSMQGTVFRGAVSMSDAFFRSRSLVIQDACRRIYEYAMGWAVRHDKTVAGAPKDWNKVSIYPPRSVNVDVGRNSQAMLAELEANATNYRAIYGPLGLDWREELRQSKEEQDYKQEIGLNAGQATPTESTESSDNPVTNADVETLQNLKVKLDAFGVGVRSGAITPTPADEQHFREVAKLPPLSPEADKAWTDEGKTRRPITLTPPPGGEAVTPPPIIEGNEN